MIGWPSDVGDWLDRVDAKAKSGDKAARTIRRYVLAALDEPQNLPHAPSPEDGDGLTEVGTSGEAVSDLAHFAPVPSGCSGATDLLVPTRRGPCRRGVAGRGQGPDGDVFYNRVATRADALIEQWKRQAKEQS